jgi:hypothetical protein
MDPVHHGRFIGKGSCSSWGILRDSSGNKGLRNGGKLADICPSMPFLAEGLRKPIVFVVVVERMCLTIGHSFLS